MESKRVSLKQKYKVAVTDNNVEAVKGKDIIVLAVKPQIFSEVAGST